MTEQNNVPHVYTALAAVLKSMAVQKNGMLPGNMGGKAYITAVDASAAAKEQFVANDLVFLPSEEVIKHENILNNNRLQVSIVITGTYTIVSTVDASSVTVSGTGDGLATGTAVASNIASTNALKNALLRTFLITEQSVEDAGKNGPGDAPAAAQAPATRKIDNARVPRPDASAGKGELDTLKAKVREAITAGALDRDHVMAVQNKIKAEQGLTGLDLQRAINKELGVE